MSTERLEVGVIAELINCRDCTDRACPWNEAKSQPHPNPQLGAGAVVRIGDHDQEWLVDIVVGDEGTARLFPRRANGGFDPDMACYGRVDELTVIKPAGMQRARPTIPPQAEPPAAPDPNPPLTGPEWDAMAEAAAGLLAAHTRWRASRAAT